MKMLAAAAVVAALAGPAFAFGDPDWPCESRKVVHLSIGQMWPLQVPEDMTAWRDDREIADAAAVIAARRTSMQQVGEILDRFAAGPEGDASLTQLFVGVFATIDSERARIVDGIVRYALRQRALSEKIDAERVDLARLEAETAADDYDTLDRIDEMRDAIVWDTRIYDERRHSLQFVCETPVILERRAFEVSRMVQARMSGG
jgi:hypothetical protein